MKENFRNTNKKLYELLEKNNSDSLLILNNFNIYYLTKFWDFECNSILIINKENKFFVTDGRFTNQVKELNLDYELITVNNQKKKFEVINELLDNLNLNKILLSYENINFKNINYLKDKKFKDLDNQILNFRSVKNKDEVKKIKKACEIAERSFINILNKINIGMSEIDIKNKLEDEMKNQGSEQIAFPTIIASGPINGAKPHAVPTDRKIEYGDLITIDFGATYQHYISDITRTICVGDINKKQINIYKQVQKAKLECEKLIKPGIKANIINNKAENIINEFGVDFVHSVGHGIGLEVHELPVLNKNNKENLLEGNVHTIEPGIYINNVGGVRIEDDYLITDIGYECLTPNITTDLIKI